MAALKIFGFEIRKAETEIGSLVPPKTEDGTLDQVSFGSGAAMYGYAFDIEGKFRSESEKIQKYRSVAQTPEIDMAIEEITSEAIVIEDEKPPLTINVFAESKEIPDQLKRTITDEFDNVVSLLRLNTDGHDLFRKWYVDGRYYGHIVVDESNIQEGIKDIRQLDARKTKKIREIIKTKTSDGIDVISGVDEYFVYNDKGLASTETTGLRLSPDVLIYAPSGLTDESGGVISHLHKSLKPYNQLRYMEDACLIYTLSRAPQRRVFYIDVADMPKQKAEQYVQDVMNRYKNKVVYDSATGDIKDDRAHQSILEDFWLPRRCFSLDTKVKLLDGRDVSIGDLATEYEQGKQNWTYSVSDEGKVVPGLITWAGTTMKNAQVVDVHLDNGEVITCTPDHKFITRNGQKIQAQHLTTGTSLMPLYTEKRVLFGNKEYEYVLDNETNNWSTTHKMVASYFSKIESSEVIHHVNFNRFDNTPTNLQVMDKTDHLKLHTKHASDSWKNATPEKREQWVTNLSNSTKEFFKTEAGMLRRKEITELNRSPKMLAALEKGREKIKMMREHDKKTLSKNEFDAKWSHAENLTPTYAHIRREEDKINMSTDGYYAKWVKPITDKNKEHHLKKMSSFDMDAIFHAINADLTPSMRNPDILRTVQQIYPSLKLEGFRAVLRFHGYDSISDFMCRNFSNLSQRRTYQAKNQAAINHKVAKVVFREDRMDVGTLTVDGDEKHHSYHNYALSAGVFVMNSNGRTTEITTLPGDSVMSSMDNIMYFMNKLYASLNLPQSRVKADQSGFNLGRASEITRDEVKFSKFVNRLRIKFAEIPLQALRVQLILKGIIAPEDWNFVKSKIKVQYQKDNFFAELKENEILQGRIQLAEALQPFVGNIFSQNYVKRNIFRLSDEEVDNMDDDIGVEQQGMQQNEKEFGTTDQDEPNQGNQGSSSGNAPTKSRGKSSSKKE